jgi:hypothetical protein
MSTLYYDGQDARITQVIFECRRPMVQVFGIRDLYYVHVVEHPRVLRRRIRELRAIHRGELVSLLRTEDERIFGQICRALMRALERVSEP